MPSTKDERPRPPSRQGESSAFCPAPELLAWVERVILSEGGALYNPDHAHLVDADLAFLWAPGAFEKAGRSVLGQAEQVMFRAGGWQKARQEQQMVEWFGRVPAFLITLAADYCADCTDANFCALVDTSCTTSVNAGTSSARLPSIRRAGRSCELSGTTSRNSLAWWRGTGLRRTYSASSPQPL